MHPFRRWLEGHFRTTPPLGYCLRADHPDRWVRLHSLPGSKRYAEDDADRREIRARAWAAASEVLPTGEPVWVVVRRFGEAARELQIPEAPSIVFEHAGRWEHALLDDPVVAYVARTTWPDGDFDGLVDAIADDRERVAWFSVATGEVFAPYDGGIDLFAEPARVASLRQVFPQEWFSSRADGL
jgi:hypothetical protein